MADCIFYHVDVHIFLISTITIITLIWIDFFLASKKFNIVGVPTVVDTVTLLNHDVNQALYHYE